LVVGEQLVDDPHVNYLGIDEITLEETLVVGVVDHSEHSQPEASATSIEPPPPEASTRYLNHNEQLDIQNDQQQENLTKDAIVHAIFETLDLVSKMNASDWETSGQAEGFLFKYIPTLRAINYFVKVGVNLLPFKY
jgi:hypothetical protein